MEKARISRLVRGPACLSVLFVLACHSDGGSRDAALTTDVAAQADSSARDSLPETVVGTVDSAVPLDRQADAVVLDSPADRGDDLAQASDTGPDGTTMFQCNFPGANPQAIFCDRGQYCLSFSGGPIGSGTTLSCAVPQTDCIGNQTCECLCGKGGLANCSVPTYPYARCTCLPDRQGPLLLCAAP